MHDVLYLPKLMLANQDLQTKNSVSQTENQYTRQESRQEPEINKSWLQKQPTTTSTINQPC